MDANEIAKVLAVEHYRRIMNDSSLLLQYCQVFGFKDLTEALKDVVKKFVALKEGEGERQ